jgi:hypothetical protein
MRYLIAFLGLALAGCSSMQKTFDSIPSGTASGDVLTQLGRPKGKEKTEDGHEAWVFAYEDEECELLMKDGKTVGPGRCREDDPPPGAGPKLNWAAARRSYMEASALVDSGRPSERSPQRAEPAYMPSSPRKTRCTTRWVGGVAQSDCAEESDGVSIYRNIGR